MAPLALLHTPEDMTVTVEANVTLADLQTLLAKARQWLPLDPPNLNGTLRDILNHNESGPRRFGYGTIREYVIGLKVELADGRTVRSGGQVVKNVAGYDLQKLFIGSAGTLGTIREVTFKLRPIPEVERLVQRHCDSLSAAGAAIEAVVESALTPIVLDLHREVGGQPAVVLGFDGTQEDVDWQIALAAQLGFHLPATLDHDRVFRAEAGSLRKLSVQPSQLIECLRALGPEAFVARAGNGIIFHRTDVAAPKPDLPLHLWRRTKDAFDPKHLLPELSP